MACTRLYSYWRAELGLVDSASKKLCFSAALPPTPQCTHTKKPCNLWLQKYMPLPVKLKQISTLSEVHHYHPITKSLNNQKDRFSEPRRPPGSEWVTLESYYNSRRPLGHHSVKCIYQPALLSPGGVSKALRVPFPLLTALLGENQVRQPRAVLLSRKMAKGSYVPGPAWCWV